MRRNFLIVALLFAGGSSLAADCDANAILQMVRPGAQYILNGDKVSDLIWLDKVQTKPTGQELLAAYNACQADLAQKTLWQTELSTTTAALNQARQVGFANLSPVNQAAVVQGILQWQWLRCQLGIDDCR